MGNSFSIQTLSSSSQPEESSSYESDVVTTLLSKLKALTVSNLARKRRVSRNPARSSKRSKTAVTTEPKISPASRVREFPNECLTVSNSKLFCTACRDPLSVKKSVIQQPYIIC